jgi:ketosteroid isomerase-like protein
VNVGTRTTADDEADIRRRIDELLAAIRAMDLDSAMSYYAPDVVSFDIEPPLKHIGARAKTSNWSAAFAAYQPPIGYEVRDLTITVSGDVAFAHSLNRISGALTDGHPTDMWLRSTTCFRRIDGIWLIVHDHVSVPFEPPTGTALTNLEP